MHLLAVHECAEQHRMEKAVAGISRVRSVASIRDRTAARVLGGRGVIDRHCILAPTGLQLAHRTPVRPLGTRGPCESVNRRRQDAQDDSSPWKFRHDTSNVFWQIAIVTSSFGTGGAARLSAVAAAPHSTCLLYTSPSPRD